MAGDALRFMNGSIIGCHPIRLDASSATNTGC
jgi:hypothetical protein